jgi:hypothetical protein
MEELVIMMKFRTGMRCKGLSMQTNFGYFYDVAKQQIRWKYRQLKPPPLTWRFQRVYREVTLGDFNYRSSQ